MHRKLLFILAFVFIAEVSQAQAFTYYPFNSVFSIATNPSKAVWADFRFQMNSYFSSLSTEVSPMFNLNKSERAKFYIGAGVKANFLNALNPDASKQSPLEGYCLNAGVRTSPVQKLPRLQVVFELSPYANKNFDLGVFRANLGLGYVLGKKKQ
ncbi:MULTISPECIES: hypothetical protein [Emticicia]|uniref:hypothetical protein n=1 Tax=Emticicia TaxID=312278 RepID=UPI0007D8BE96|nr:MULTISPECIES: hypothetical protein [Emticicia]